MLDRVTETDTYMTTTAEQSNATIDLNDYRHERWCLELIILSLSARLCASHGGSCCVKPIAVLYLTVDGSTSHDDYTYSYKPTTTIGFICLEEMWRNI